MIDAKDFIKDDEVDYALIDDVIHDSEDSPFDICRLAIKYSELDHSVKIGDYVKTKGYDLIVNLMGITLLTDTQIYDFVNVMGGLDPLVLYFADSLGAMLDADIKKTYKAISNNWSKDIGFHAHNNLGKAGSTDPNKYKTTCRVLDNIKRFLKWCIVRNYHNQFQSAMLYKIPTEQVPVDSNLAKPVKATVITPAEARKLLELNLSLIHI